MGTYRFPQCIGTIDDIHIEIAEPNEHYFDYINREGYFSLNVEVMCAYKYLFQNVVIKWLGSVHDYRVFLNSSVNKMLRKGPIPQC